MALGNSNSSSQSRGKNKPVMVKRRKEVVMARGYNSVVCSPVQASNACSFGGSLTNTFYHSGRAALPAVNDIVYSTRRANLKTAVEVGHYKILVSRVNYNMEITANGVVSRVDACRR